MEAVISKFITNIKEFMHTDSFSKFLNLKYHSDFNWTTYAGILHVAIRNIWSL